MGYLPPPNSDLTRTHTSYLYFGGGGSEGLGDPLHGCAAVNGGQYAVHQSLIVVTRHAVEYPPVQ